MPNHHQPALYANAQQVAPSRSHPTTWRFSLELALGLVFLLAGQASHAQVIRCTDARSGKVTYTDGTCDAGQRSAQVQARKTEQELALERAQASEALEQKHKRQEAQADAEQRQLEREALQAQRARSMERPAAPADYAQSPACGDARRALSAATGNLARTPEEQATRIDAAQQQMDFACLGPEGYARAQASRSSQAPVVVVQPPAWPIRPRPPRPEPLRGPYIKECTSFTCTDSNGKRYPRTGRGSFDER